jgi:hypothetical protein
MKQVDAKTLNVDAVHDGPTLGKDLGAHLVFETATAAAFRLDYVISHGT